MTALRYLWGWCADVVGALAMTVWALCHLRELVAAAADDPESEAAADASGTYPGDAGGTPALPVADRQAGWWTSPANEYAAVLAQREQQRRARVLLVQFILGLLLFLVLVAIAVVT